MNQTMRELVQFNKAMANELANFKQNEEVLLQYISKVDDIDKRGEERIADLENDYDEKINFLMNEVKALKHH